MQRWSHTWPLVLVQSHVQVPAAVLLGLLSFMGNGEKNEYFPDWNFRKIPIISYKYHALEMGDKGCMWRLGSRLGLVEVFPLVLL